MEANQAVLHAAERRGKSTGAAVSGMMPLNMARQGEALSVQSVHGKDETRRFLESLGFVTNAAVTVVTELGGNIIVNVKGTRVAISRAMANRVYVC